MPEPKQYIIQVPGEEQAAYWDEAKFKRNQDQLYKDHQDAQVTELSPANLDAIDDAGSYWVGIPNDPNVAQWDGAKLKRNREQLLKDHPDAQIYSTSHQDYGTYAEGRRSAAQAELDKVNRSIADAKGKASSSKYSTSDPALAYAQENYQQVLETGQDMYGNPASPEMIQAAYQQYKAEQDYANAPGTADLERRKAELEKQIAGYDEGISAYQSAREKANRTPEANELIDIYTRIGELQRELDGLPPEQDYRGLSREEAVQYAQAANSPEGRRRSEIRKELDQLREAKWNNPAYQAYLEAQKEDIRGMMSAMEEGMKKNAPGPERSANMSEQEALDIASGAEERPGDQQEQDYYSTARRYYGDALKAAEAPSKYDDGFAIGLANFGKGVGRNIMSAVSILELANALQDVNVINTVKEIQKAEGKDVDLQELINEHPDRLSYLSEGQREMMKAFIKRCEIEQLRSDDTSIMYNAGAGAIQSVGFMADFLATGGVGTAAGKATAKALAKTTTEEIAGRTLGAQAKKMLVGNLEAVTKALVMTPMMPSSYANFITNLTQLNEYGQMDLSTQAVLKSVGDVFIETFSENAGELFGIPFDGQYFDFISNNKLGEIGKAMSRTGAGQFLKQAGWHGLVGEMAEEVLGNAMRSALNVDENALKDFFSGDQFWTTLASFAPMSIVGAGSSAIQVRRASKNMSKRGEELTDILTGLGMDEETIGQLLDVSKKDSVEKLGAAITAIGQRAIASGQVTEENVEDLGMALGHYAIAASQYKVLQGVLEGEADIARVQNASAIEGRVGDNRWYHEGEDGNYVRSITLEDGSEWFVVPTTDGDEDQIVAVGDNGQIHFFQTSLLEGGVEEGLIKDSGEMRLYDYLDGINEEQVKAAEQERMLRESEEQLAALRQRIAENPTLNVGTEEAPVNASVIASNDYGVRAVWVDAQGTQIQKDFTWAEVADFLGSPIDVKTDEQIEEEEVQAEEDIRSRKEDYNKTIPVGTEFTAFQVEGEEPVTYKFQRAFINEDGTMMLQVTDKETGKDGQITEEMALQGNLTSVLDSFKTPAEVQQEETVQEEEETPVDDGVLRDFRGNPIPLREDGSVNQTAFWNADPEAWARWNDSVRQDGGANSRGYIAKAISKLQADAAAVQQQMANELDFDRIDQLEGQLGQINSRIADLERIENNYANAEVAQAEAMQTPSETSAPVAETTEAAPVAEVAPEVQEDAEATRVQALKDRVRAWVERTGVEADALESIDQVQNKQAAKAIAEGQPVAGWFEPSTGKVVIYLPNIMDEAEIDRTYMHEVISHKGLRDLLGNEGWNTLMDSVWDNLMTDKDRADYLKYNSHLKGSEEFLRRAAADEYVAHLAETVDPENAGAWQKFVEMVKEILLKLGMNVKLTTEDLSNLLQASLANYERMQAEKRAAAVATQEAGTGEQVTPQNELTKEITANLGGQIEGEGGNQPTLFSIKAIAEGAGFQANEGNESGDVTFTTSDGRVFDGHHPLTVEDVRGEKNSVMNYMMEDARRFGTITPEQEEIIWQKYTDVLNRMLEKGLEENGGYEKLSSQWQWVGETVFKTVSTNSDEQYSYSLDITRVCKKNEAVINSISAMQRRVGYGITPGQVMDIYLSSIEEGYQVPCPVCYVFSRYIANGKYATIAINGQKKYGKYLVDPSSLSDKERKERIKFWVSELEKQEKKNEANEKKITKAKQDISNILDQIDKLGKTILEGKSSEAEKQAALKEIEKLDRRYKAALNVVSQSSLTSWIKTFAIKKVKGGWKLYDDSFQGFPEEYALDLRLTAETIRKYPAIQRLRKSGGSAAGKEIHFAANNDIGDVTMMLGASNLKTAQNYYKKAVEAKTEKERAAALKDATERFRGAMVYAQMQSLRGGQRMWSWSDNIERLAPDVFVNLMQLQMLGGALQSYSKQLEGANLVATMGGYVNGSLMAYGIGYQAVDADAIDVVDGKEVLKNDITDTVTEKTAEGDRQRTRFLAKAGSPVFTDKDGKKVVLLFDDVVGIDAYGRDEDGVHMKGLFDLNATLDKAGNILVGMDDTHIRAAMADDRVFFIIPWHASGQSVHILTQMLGYLGVDIRKFNPKDYTNVQEEKSAVGEDGKIIPNLVEFWEAHNYEADYKCGIEGGIPSGKNGKLSKEQKEYRALRDAIFTDPNLVNDKARMRKIKADEFLSQVWDKVHDTVSTGQMTKGDTKFIYPYEYWDEDSTYENADVNGKRYLEYCRRMGVKPKFIGKLDGNPEKDFGNFADDKGFWKLLIDRRMYKVDGSFQDLTPVSTEEFTPDLIDPKWTEKEFVVTTVADSEGVERIAERAIQKEQERPGGLASVNYDMTLEQAIKEQDKVTEPKLTKAQRKKLTQAQQNVLNYLETGEFKSEQEPLEAINATQKQPASDAVQPVVTEEDVMFRLSKNNKATVESWLKKREDINDEQRAEVVDYIDKLDDAKTQLATAKWYANGTIRLPEDMKKVEQAISVSGKAKVDPLRYNSPMELLDAHAEFKPSEERINPDEVSTLHRSAEYPDNGIVVYDVDNTEESRKNMREIINTHFGKDASPWCLLQGDGKGNLTPDSKRYWNHYNAYPKQVAFKDGKLLAFSANDTHTRVWWDRKDQSHYGIPITKKIDGDELGRSATYILSFNTDVTDTPGELSKEAGSHLFRGNRQNGVYEEWSTDGSTILERTNYKDGEEDGLTEAWYPNGQMQRRTTMKNGNYAGRYEAWFDNGQKQVDMTLTEEGFNDGERKAWWKNGNLRSEGRYKNSKRVGEHRSWDEDGNLEAVQYYSEDADYLGFEDHNRWGIQRKVTFTEDNGQIDERYYRGGRLVSVARTKNGKLEGLQEYFYPDGIPQTRAEYSNGERNGIFERYHPNGKLLAKGEFKDGKREGIHEVYNKYGDLITRQEYHNDEKVRELPLDENVQFRKVEPIVDEKSEALFEQAKKTFGTTNNLAEAGYVIPDGSMLDFSGRHLLDPGQDSSWMNGMRQVDHREITDLNYEKDGNTPSGYETDMRDFIRRGAIRLNSGVINLATKPTKGQENVLWGLIQRANGDVDVDFGDGYDSDHYASYNHARPERILNDIRRYFDEGIEPEGNVMFRLANQSQNGFISNAEMALDKIKMDKATPEQWIKMLEKEGGLKAGEDKWLGLSDWLKASDKKTLTKDEISDFIEQNRIQIEEQRYSEMANLTEERDAAEALQRYQDEFDSFASDYINGDVEYAYSWPSASAYAFEQMVEKYGDDFRLAFEVDGNTLAPMQEFDDDFNGATRHFLGLDTAEERRINPVRLDYTTPGLDNKAEIALTVPTIDPWNESDMVHFGDAGEGRAIAWIRFGDTTISENTETPSDGLTQEEREELNRLEEEVAERGRTFREARSQEEMDSAEGPLKEAMARRDAFKNEHQPKRTEAPSQRVLVIDEIQSKRHQEAREKGGYIDSRTDVEELEEKWRTASKAYDDYVDSLKEKYDDLGWPDEMTDEEEQRVTELNEASIAAAEAVDKAKVAIPAAPFEKNWHELAMKRMLRLAAEEGYDKIAWTTGDQQAERYNLGNIVDSIEATKWNEEADTKLVALMPKSDDEDMISSTIDREGKILDSDIKEWEGKSLSDVCGKDIAQKIVEADDEVFFEMDDLRVGGEGMRGFYDDILPRFMNKYGKKWGVKVQDIVLPGIGDTGLTMHSVDVTPEMKESVMEGQVMFRKTAPNGQPSNLTDEQWEQVRTPEFKAWFGDWENDPENASKVVDENGEPRVVYHGSKWNPLKEEPGKAVFDENRVGENFDWVDIDWNFFFTASEASARGYGRAIPVFLNIRNMEVHTIRESISYEMDEETGHEIVVTAHDAGSENDEVTKVDNPDGVMYTIRAVDVKESERRLAEAIKQWEGEHRQELEEEYNSLKEQSKDLIKQINDEYRRLYDELGFRSVLEMGYEEMSERAGYVVDQVVKDAAKLREGVSTEKLDELEKQFNDVDQKMFKISQRQGIEGRPTYEEYEQYEVEKDYKTTDIFAVDRPNQIKSAVANNGNFSPDNDDIRFSLRGIIGAENAEDEVALDNLEVAEEMENAGKDSQTIWKATGWERGADGKWRNEIPDAKQKEGVSLKKHNIAGEVLDAPELFDSYPELAELPIDLVGLSGVAGVYSRAEKRIKLDTDYNTKEGGEGRDLTKNGIMTILHELQHAIQQIEGFAKGANEKQGERLYYREALKTNPNETYFAWFLSRKNSARRLNMVGREKVIRYAENYDKSRLTDLDRKYFANLIDYLKGISNDEFKKFVSRAAKVAKTATKAGEESYEKSAGEVEARNVEQRALMTEEGRKEFSPDITEDTARHEQIVLFRLNQDAVKQSREGGLTGVIGDENAAELYRNVYKAVPKEIRQQIVDKAGDSYLFSEATKDMISEAVEKGDKTGIAGLAANMLRDYAGDLDERTARYILWRGDRKVEDDDLLDTVNDIAMQRRLKVGQFAEQPMFRKSPISPEQDKEYLDAVESGDMEKARQMVKDAFKAAFPDTKVVDEDGKPAIVYHGSTWNPLEEKVGEGVFKDSFRGTGSGDNGFFGRGFYFTYGNGELSRAEAGYYGRTITEAFLNIENPFLFNETLYEYNGARNVGDEKNSVEAINMVKNFPELCKHIFLTTFNGKGEEDGEIALEDYATLFEEVYRNKAFIVNETDNSDIIEVLADPVSHRYTNPLGKEIEWTDYAFRLQMYRPGKNEDAQLAFTHFYLTDMTDLRREDAREMVISLPSNLFSEIFESEEFTNTLKARGYDGVLQSAKGDEAVAFNANQIKSAEPVTYDDEGNVIPLSERFNPERDDIRFRLGEDIEDAENRANSMADDAKATLDEKKAEARKDDALTTIKAMSLQKEYDRKTVNTLTVLAKNILKDQSIETLSRHEIARLLGIVTTSIGKAPKTVKKNADALMGMIIDHLLKSEETKLGMLVRIRAEKTNQTGVQVAAKLDPRGQKILKFYKEGLEMPLTNPENRDDVQTIGGRLIELTEKMESKDATERAEGEEEYAGLMLAKEYLENIRDSRNEVRELRRSMADAAAERKAGKMSKTAYDELVEENEKGIRQKKIERVEAYRALYDKMEQMIAGSIEALRDFKEDEKARVDEIHHIANKDMEGRDATENPQTTVMGRLANSSLVRFFTQPLATFEQMLRLFGEKSVTGEGFLFNFFHRGWVDAQEKAYLGEKEAKSELDAKVSEVFDEKMRWSDLYAEERKMPNVKVKWWDAGRKEMVEHELSQGQLLYIYMVNKMTDGRMKLRRMGITQEHVDAIKRQMDFRFLELADWLQEEYLVKRRNKYDAVHVRLFGAHMAAIEDYFPLKINKNAIDKEVNIGLPDLDDALPASTTGAIIKRRMNTRSLDLLNADAFSVVIEHIEQMERWAAFAEYNKNLSTLLSYKRFRNQLRSMTSVYGSGEVLLKNFEATCEIVGGTYRPAGKKSGLDRDALSISKGLTAAKISFRVYTAMKQLLSMPAFLADANVKYLGQNLATPWKAWKWAMENLPLFEKRWKSRQAGDTRLMQNESDWKVFRTQMYDTLSRLGMSPNAFVDAMTVSIGAHSIYQTRYDRYIKDGYTEEQADRKAKQDATTLYNETQQSSEAAFISKVQLDRTWAAAALTVFRNSSMGYQRQLHDAIRNLGKMTKTGYKTASIEFMKRQMVEEGLTEEQAQAAAERNYDREVWRSFARIGTFGFLVQFAWNLGPYLAYLLVGGDDDKKEEMLKDAAIHAMAGSVEGLAGGNVMSEIFNKVMKGESLNNYDPTLMPIVSDVQNTYKKMNSNPVAAWYDLVCIGIQSGLGVNPQTFSDAIVAVVDACDGDLETSKEAMLLFLRIIQTPQSQLDQIYIDELGINGTEASGLSMSEMAERYARYKMNKEAGPFVGFHSEESEKKRRDTYNKRFKQLVKERKEINKPKDKK